MDITDSNPQEPAASPFIRQSLVRSTPMNYKKKIQGLSNAVQPIDVNQNSIPSVLHQETLLSEVDLRKDLKGANLLAEYAK